VYVTGQLGQRLHGQPAEVQHGPVLPVVWRCNSHTAAHTRRTAHTRRQPNCTSATTRAACSCVSPAHTASTFSTHCIVIDCHALRVSPRAPPGRTTVALVRAARRRVLLAHAALTPGRRPSCVCAARVECYHVSFTSGRRATLARRQAWARGRTACRWCWRRACGQHMRPQGRVGACDRRLLPAVDSKTSLHTAQRSDTAWRTHTHTCTHTHAHTHTRSAAANAHALDAHGLVDPRLPRLGEGGAARRKEGDGHKQHTCLCATRALVCVCVCDGAVSKASSEQHTNAGTHTTGGTQLAAPQACASKHRCGGECARVSTRTPCLAVAHAVCESGTPRRIDARNALAHRGMHKHRPRTRAHLSGESRRPSQT
jgi:hypothetical protein